MTTIITRLFPSRESAAAVAADLDLKRFPRRAVHVITSSSDEGAEAVSAQLERLEVDPAAATAYTDHLTKGDTALLVVRATYKPLGAARIAREALADADTIDVGQVPDDIYVPDRPERTPSVLTDHPHMLMLPMADDEIPRGPVTGNFFRLLSPHRTKMSAMSGDNRMSRFFWPMPLLKRHRTANSAIHGGRVMSRRFWPQKLLLSGPRRKAVIPGGGHPMSRLFGWPLISHRR